MAHDYNSDTMTYFAARKAEETAAILMAKSEDWYNNIETNGYLDKLRSMWAAYHGIYYTDFTDAHMISFGGEQGEQTKIAVNHLRNLARHILNIVTSSRPAVQCRAINSDQQSLVQARLGNGLLNYYLKEKRLENCFQRAAEYAIVLAAGYVKVEWNEMSGEVFDVLENGAEIREGDLRFCNLSPFDVVYDVNREDQDHDWVMSRSFKNRFGYSDKSVSGFFLINLHGT